MRSRQVVHGAQLRLTVGSSSALLPPGHAAQGVSGVQTVRPLKVGRWPASVGSQLPLHGLAEQRIALVGRSTPSLGLGTCLEGPVRPRDATAWAEARSGGRTSGGVRRSITVVGASRSRSARAEQGGAAKNAGPLRAHCHRGGGPSGTSGEEHGSVLFFGAELTLKDRIDCRDKRVMSPRGPSHH